MPRRRFPVSRYPREVSSLLSRALRLARSAAGTTLRAAAETALRPATRRPRPAPPRTGHAARPGPPGDRPAHPGAVDRSGAAHGVTVEYDVARLGLPPLQYAPERDGDPDPGEVVWTWVSYEDDPSQGKDRPVLVISRQGERLVVLQLTSKDKDRDRAAEAARGRHWLDIGTGAWDSRGRDSEVRLDRPLWAAAGDVRREGAALDRARYDDVVRALREVHAR